MERDISEKIEKIVKISLPALLLAALAAAFPVWLYQSSSRQLSLYDAKVNGRMVQTRARTDGSVIEVAVEEGSTVKAGQVIAKVKVNITDEQLKQLKHNVTLAEQNLAKLREGNVITRPVYNAGAGRANAAAEEKLARMEELYRLGAISAAERDAAVAAARATGGSGSVSYETIVQPSSPEALQNGELRLKQAQEALKNAQQNLTATEITAPVAGTVFLQELQAGAEVKPGQVLALIGSSDELWLEAQVEKERTDKIFVGQYAKYTINGKSFEGTVMDIVSGEDKVVVFISLPENAGGIARPGQKAEIKLALP